MALAIYARGPKAGEVEEIDPSTFQEPDGYEAKQYDTADTNDRWDWRQAEQFVVFVHKPSTVIGDDRANAAMDALRDATAKGVFNK